MTKTLNILYQASTHPKIFMKLTKTPSIKTKNEVVFLTRLFLITNSLNIDKKRLCSTVDLFYVVRVILFSIYKIYKRFYFFQGGFEVLKLQYFKLLYQGHIQNLLKHLRWSFLLKAVKSFQRKIHLRYLLSLVTWNIRVATQVAKRLKT